MAGRGPLAPPDRGALSPGRRATPSPGLRFAAFAALLAVLGALAWRAGSIESHWDEDSCVATGWLLAKGWLLYGDVFTHHMPLEYVPPWGLALLFGGKMAAGRAFMLALWAGACLGLYRTLRERGEAPWLFALLSSQWLTFWHGQMMLVENLWGWAVALLLALLGGPLALGRGTPAMARSRAGFAAGILLGVLLCSAIVTVLPFILLAAWLAFDPAWRGARRWAAAGAGCWLVVFALWCWRHVALSQWWSQAVWFNSAIYGKFYGYKGGPAPLEFLWRAVIDNVVYFWPNWSFATPEGYFEGVLKLAVLGWIAGLALARRRLEALWWAVFIVALKSRAERIPLSTPFHSAPFYLAATLLLARELELGWRAASERLRPLPRAGAAVLAAAALAPTLAATSIATESLRRFASEDPEEIAVREALRSCTSADARIGVFPYTPRLYLDTDRLPAAPGIFYVPWQHSWDRQRAATLDGLRRTRPEAVVVRDVALWGIPWKAYGGEIEAFLAGGYLQVSRGTAPGHEPEYRVFARKDLAAGFVKCVNAGQAGGIASPP